MAEKSDAMPRTAMWYDTSWLLLTDILGTSALTMSGVARQLGWFWTVTAIMGMSPLAIYTGILLSRTRCLLAENMMEPATMGHAAQHALGDGARTAVRLVVYGIFGFFGNSSYLLTMGQSLQGMYPMCLPTAVLISCCCVLPLALAFRHLQESVWLCQANFFVLLAVLVLVLWQMAAAGTVPGSQRFLFAEELSFAGFFGAVANVLYSYAGHWLYFEMMAEMKRPSGFPGVLLVNAPFQVGIYLCVACVSYHFAGDKAQPMLMHNMAPGWTAWCANALLFAHVWIAFLLKNVVISRCLHGVVSSRANELSTKARLEYMACSLFLVAASFLVANVVPFFNDLLGLIGALLAGPVSFLLPIALWLGARRVGAASSPLLEGGAADDEEPSDERSAIAPMDVVLIAVVIAFTLLTMTAGTFNVLEDIAGRMKYSSPFACKLRS